MTTTLVLVAVAALASLNLVLTLGLARRVRTLQEGSTRDPSLPHVGDRPEAFEAVTLQGERLTQSSCARGSALVGFFAPGCETCIAVRAHLLENPPGMPLYAFVVSPERDQETEETAKSLTAIAKVAVVAYGEPASKAFGDSGYPTLIRLHDGAVTASGHRIADVLP